MVPMGDRKRIAISSNQIASLFVCCDVTNYSSNDDFHMNWQIDQHDEYSVAPEGWAVPGTRRDTLLTNPEIRK
jgi:hypothetical protein